MKTKKRAEKVTACEHCHEPIMLFNFAEGKQWWHVSLGRAIGWQRCWPRPDSPMAEPRK